jgi:uncharacterized repeat protein (TIGR01451 family)
MGTGRYGDGEARVTKSTKLILCAMAIGGALVLLCSCAQQEQPTVTPDGIRLSVRTAIPTLVPASASLPSPSPTAELAAEPLVPTPTIKSSAPSAADLAIEVIPDETSIYTLTIRNLGPDPATGIVLTDVLPSRAIPLWTEPAQPMCGRQERDVGCDLGRLEAGGAATVTLDLSLGGTEVPISGTQLAGVTVTLSAPTCVLDRESSPPQVTCRLSRLQPGAEARVRVGVGGEDPAGGKLVHTATVTAHETDPDRSNNCVTSAMVAGMAAPVAVTAVSPATDLVIWADGPETVVAGRPFTYTYVITNHGASAATSVWFEDAVPSDMNLVAYAPGLPRCEQQGDLFTCNLRDVDSGEAVSFTLRITGYGEQPMVMSLDPLLPGWPICTVLKERTWLHIVQCELGELAPGQATRVQLVLEAIGVVERTSANTATVRASEADLNPIDNSSTTTITIEIGGELDGD